MWAALMVCNGIVRLYIVCSELTHINPDQTTQLWSNHCIIPSVV